MTPALIRVLICDDSRLIREMLQAWLTDEPGIEVVGTAAEPQEAREKIKRLKPDVLTLDIEMPGMDGLSFLEKIMTLRPMPVVMISTLTQKGAEATLRALELGAVEYIPKPLNIEADQALDAFRAELIAKVRAAAQSRPRTQSPAAATARYALPKPVSAPEIIAFGSSTGGVEALRAVFAALPGSLPPIVMTQHMPETFTRTFAARLDQHSAVRVQEASDDAPLTPGCAYLAPGNRHLRVERRPRGYVCRLQDSAPVSGHKPSVDVLFHSVAQAAGAKALGIILTGMGRDGADGLLAMRTAGAVTLGQDEASAIVYGMPRVAMERGGVQLQLPLSQMAGALVQLTK